MSIVADLDELKLLQAETHKGEVRADRARLEQLLHTEFIEIGSSGEVYSRAEVLDEFDGRPPTYQVCAQDYRAERLAEGLVLLNYKSAHVGAGGTLERHTLRTSLWQLTDKGWRLRFHQGTPIEPLVLRVKHPPVG